MNIEILKTEYQTNGFVSSVDVIDSKTALAHRQVMESAEAKVGLLHYKPKIHTILKSPFELATDPKILDFVECLIGPNILLYNITYIVKEPHTTSHVSWHQDLTYWGLNCDDQVSMWLALSPATRESGCMRMLPGSHLGGQKQHTLTDDENNVLYSGQTVTDVAEDESVMCKLRPGQGSFHHGWTLHASMPNCSDDRRIGLNVQYLATHVRQTKDDGDSAILVRGEDTYNHFAPEVLPEYDLAPEAIAQQEMLEQRYITISEGK